ncbi:MAG: hypothetical protein U1E73_11570 [Planctomycetota bacterium]
MQAAACRELDYLPRGATIDTTVYLMIKLRPNSFVWDLATRAAIFPWLDPR